MDDGVSLLRTRGSEPRISSENGQVTIGVLSMSEARHRHLTDILLDQRETVSSVPRGA
jgi:hypothetical protein